MSNNEVVKKHNASIIRRQQNAATRILRNVSEVFSETAYLAGGMLRDHYFGQPGNDFDVYIPVNKEFDYETFMIPMLNGIENFHDFKRMGSINEDQYGYLYNSSAIHSIYEGKYSTFNEDVPIQIIVLHTSCRDYIENHFCCSLSKVWQTFNWKPVYAEEFMRSIRDNRIMFDFSMCTKWNADYVKKICNRYPDMDIDPFTKDYLKTRFERDAYWGL